MKFETQAVIRWISILVLWCSALWIHVETLDWLAAKLTRPDSSLNAILFCACVLFLGFKTHRAWGGTQQPGVPLLVFMVGVGFSCAVFGSPLQHYGAVLGASLMLFGATGFWLSRSAWLRLAAPLLLLLSTLPVAGFLDIYLGFPLRRVQSNVIASLVRHLMAVQLEGPTVLRFENGLASVDLPCSGVKSLWTGAMLCLGATCCSNRRIGLRWGVASVGFACLLLLANAARIFVLTLIGFAADLPRVAEWVHLPLGFAGFSGAAMAYLVALRRLLPASSEERVVGRFLRSRPRICTLGGAALVGVLGAAFVSVHSSFSEHTPEKFRAQVEHATPVPLSPIESRHFDSFDSTTVSKWQLKDPYSGSVLIAYSRDLRAHHRPERCFAEAGMDVSEVTQVLLAWKNHRKAGASFGLKNRTVVARIGTTHSPVRGYYWFQSSERITHDYSDRIFSSALGTEDEWVLVSVVVGGASTSDARLIEQLQRTVHRALLQRKLS